MPTPTINDYLKYANLQGAAEAFLVNNDGKVKTDIKQALIDGNKRSTKFTQPQAEDFNKLWQVVDQCPNTLTGFSGTLFRAIKEARRGNQWVDLGDFDAAGRLRNR